MSELKPCPFCGNQLETWGVNYRHPLGTKCVLMRVVITPTDVEAWNLRPAPEAATDSAAVRIEPPAVADLPAFPTMLRKMWSGGEVQQWINDNIKPLVQERHHDFHYSTSADVQRTDAVPHFDMLTHLARQREFSERTFGPGQRTKGVVDHIRKELVEIEESPSDFSEWADVVILALDGFWRAGATPQQIIDTIVAKQTKNEARTWPDWRTADPDKAIEHDRSTDRASRPVDAGNQDAHGSIAPMTPEELAAQPDWIKNARPPEPTK